MNSKTPIVPSIFVFTILLILLVITFSPQTTATAAGFYVDPVVGNNGGNGSEASPWKTITFALTQVSSGDVIHLKSGTYSTQSGESFPINLKPGISLVGVNCSSTIISGDAVHDTLYINAAGANFINNSSVSDIQFKNGRYGIAIYASNSKVVSTAFNNICANANEYGLHITTSEAYENGATINSVFENSTFSNNSLAGVYMKAYGYFSSSSVVPQFRNSEISDNGTYGLFLESSAVSNNETTTGPIISETTISHNGNHGIYALGMYSGWLKPEIIKTHILDNQGYGFFWEQGINGGNIDSEIVNSVIARNQGGLSIGLRDDSPGEISITNNTIVDNKEYGIYWLRNNTNPVIPTITNSILWNPDGDDLLSDDTYLGAVTWPSDNMHNSIVHDGDLNGVNGNFAAYPQFSADYRIDSCSPAVDAGTIVSLVDDFENDLRPYNLQFDIGADEANQPCFLQSQLDAETMADWGEILHYTVTITNSSTLTGTNVSLTNIIPAQSTYVANSLWSSTGTGSFSGGQINWSGFLDPSSTATIGWEARIIKADLTLRNVATFNSAAFGANWSSWETQVPPLIAHMPLIMVNYCAAPFVDDFSNPNSGWPVLDNGSTIYRYLAGEYNIFHRDANRWTAVTRGDYWLNATGASVSGRIAENTGVWGMIFGLNDDWTDFYTFELTPHNQTWYLFHYTSTGGWYLIGSGTGSVIHSGQAINKIELKANGNNINFRVNDNFITTLYLYWPFSGRIGLTGGSFAGNTSIYYDNYLFAGENCPLTTNSFSIGNDIQSITLERPNMEALMNSQD